MRAPKVSNDKFGLLAASKLSRLRSITNLAAALSAGSVGANGVDVAKAGIQGDKVEARTIRRKKRLSRTAGGQRRCRLKKTFAKEEKCRGMELLDALQNDVRKVSRGRNIDMSRPVLHRIMINLKKIPVGDEVLNAALMLETLAATDTTIHHDMVCKSAIQVMARITEKIALAYPVKGVQLRNWRILRCFVSTIKELTVPVRRETRPTMIHNGILKVLLKAALFQLLHETGRIVPSAESMVAMIPEWDKGTTKFSAREDGDLEKVKAVTRMEALKVIENLCSDSRLRPLLARCLVVDALLLITGGRQEQVKEFDGRPLTAGCPKYSVPERRKPRWRCMGERALLFFSVPNILYKRRVRTQNNLPAMASFADEKLTDALLRSRDGEQGKLKPSSRVQNSEKTMMMATATATTTTTTMTMPVTGMTWSILGNLVKTSEERIRDLEDQEREFREVKFEREKIRANAFKYAKVLNESYEKRIAQKERQKRLDFAFSPAGRMAEIRRMYGLDRRQQDNTKTSKSAFQNFDKKSKKKATSAELGSVVTSNDFDTNSTLLSLDMHDEFVGDELGFGEVATHGRAYWENWLVKKPRPTREELAFREVDVEADREPEHMRPILPDFKHHAGEESTLLRPVESKKISFALEPLFNLPLPAGCAES